MARQTRAEARAQTILRKQIRSTKYQAIPLSPANAVGVTRRGGMTR